MALESSPKHPPKTVEDRERVIVRFAGDSGDGVQLAGTRLTDATAMFGNDLATLPDFPITQAHDGEALVHDARREDPSPAFALSRLSLVPNGPTPIGIFRSELDALLLAGSTWVVA